MPSTQYRRIAALVLFCALYLALAIYSEYWIWRETEGRIADDFGIYYQAYLRANAGENPYTPYKIGLSFIYHPFALTWVSILSWVNVRSAAILWIIASALAWMASVVLAIRLLSGSPAPEQGTDQRSPWGWLAVILMMFFAPLGESLHVGQINCFVVLGLVLTCYCSQRQGLGWEIAAALSLGFAALIKTSPIVLVLGFLALRRYRLVFISLLSMVLLSIIPAIQFYPSLLAEFASTVLLIGSDIHHSLYNLSILRVAWQFMRHLGIQGVDGALVRMLQVTSGLLLGSLTLSAWLAARRQCLTRPWFFGLVISLMVMASPIVWYHHYTLLLFPILALVLHEHGHTQRLGLAALLLIQSERALTDIGLPAGLAVLAGQIIILLVLGIAYVGACWPADEPRQH